MPRSSKAVDYDESRAEAADGVPVALLESLERSKAQAEVGLSVKLEPALDRLRASVARIKTKRVKLEEA